MQSKTYRTATIDGYILAPSKSQCAKCALLIDGIVKRNCKKHPDGFEPELWNNEIECPDRQEKMTEHHHPYRTEE